MSAPSPEEVVQGQVDAYNAKDVDRFLSFYSPDLVITELSTGRVIASGRDELRLLYTHVVSRTDDLRCQIVKRMALGKFVVDEERVFGLPAGTPVRALAIYEVADGLIVRVWMTRE